MFVRAHGHAPLLVLVLLAGCKSDERLSPEVEKLGRATGPVDPSLRIQQSQAAASKIHSGKVVETMDASRYTYVKFEPAQGRHLWAAIPKSKVKVGQTVNIVESLVMKDFSSPTLKRTFPLIVFGVLRDAPLDGGVAKDENAKAIPPGHSPINADIKE